MSEGKPATVYVCDVMINGKRVTQATASLEQAKQFIVQRGHGMITRTTINDAIFNKQS